VRVIPNDVRNPIKNGGDSRLPRSLPAREFVAMRISDSHVQHRHFQVRFPQAIAQLPNQRVSATIPTVKLGKFEPNGHDFASEMRQSPVVNQLLIDLLFTCEPPANLIFTQKTAYKYLSVLCL
jgi:hypothetical protein